MDAGPGGMIAALKFLHLAALCLWCAALVALPLLLRRAPGPQQFVRFRRLTHYGYVGFATPAALVSIAAGTGLMFAARVFDPWFLLKLALVAALVLTHVWLGHLIQTAGEKGRPARPRAAAVALVLALPLMALILVVVLAKPDLPASEAWLPDWLLRPQGGGP